MWAKPVLGDLEAQGRHWWADGYLGFLARVCRAWPCWCQLQRKLIKQTPHQTRAAILEKTLVEDRILMQGVAKQDEVRQIRLCVKNIRFDAEGRHILAYVCEAWKTVTSAFFLFSKLFFKEVDQRRRVCNRNRVCK